MTGDDIPRSGDSLVARLGTLALVIAALALVGLVFTQLWQVVGRYVFNVTPGWTETISALLMNTVMMFGAAGGVQSGAHFSFTLGIDWLPPAASRSAHALGELLVGILGAALLVYGWKLMVDTWPVKVAGAALPQGMLFAPLCLGGLLILVFALDRCRSTLQATGRVR